MCHSWCGKVFAMKKELLLQKKRSEIKSLTWYAKNIISDDVLKQFSLQQIHLICEIFQKAEDYREKCSPFYILSACEVLQKKTGKIAYFDDCSDVIYEEMEEEVLNGAASEIYKNYMEKKLSK